MRGGIQTHDWGHSTLWVYETRMYVVLSQGEKMGIKPWEREREISSLLVPYLGNPHHQHLPTHHSYLPGPILIILRLGAGHRHDPSSKSAERSRRVHSLSEREEMSTQFEGTNQTGMRNCRRSRVTGGTRPSPCATSRVCDKSSARREFVIEFGLTVKNDYDSHNLLRL
jgi:hypothetical protein